MSDLSSKTGFVYCPICGDAYDARKNAYCPKCGPGKGGFGPTGDPNANKGAGGETRPPRGGSNSAGGETRPPRGGDWGGDNPVDPFKPTIPLGNKDTPSGAVVGWLVAVTGPCRGQDYPLHIGYNYIGREEGDVIITGDMNISSRRDSAVLFDDSSNMFLTDHVDGKNLLRLNGAPVFRSTELKNYDRITIGATELVFLGLCGEHFSWGKQDD